MKNIFMPELGGLRNMTFTRQAAVFVSARHGNHGGGEKYCKTLRSRLHRVAPCKA